MHKVVHLSLLVAIQEKRVAPVRNMARVARLEHVRTHLSRSVHHRLKLGRILENVIRATERQIKKATVAPRQPLANVVFQPPYHAHL